MPPSLDAKLDALAVALDYLLAIAPDIRGDEKQEAQWALSDAFPVLSRNMLKAFKEREL